MAHPGGRPLIFTSPEEMQTIIDQYFDDDKILIKTICGLAIALGFSCRETIYEYAKRPQFSDIVKTAMLRVEDGYERRANSTTPTGPIFVLKNMGWSDKQEIEHSGTLSIAQQIIEAHGESNDNNIQK